MTVGKLDRLGKLLQKKTVRDSAGTATDSWVEIENVWVSRPEIITGKLAEIAAKTSTSAMYKFEARFRHTIKAYMRMMIEGVNYDLVTVTEVGARKSTLMITASVVV